MELEKSQFGNPQNNTCFKQESRDAKGSTCEWPRTDLQCQGAPYKDFGVILGSLPPGAERVGGARHLVWKEGYETELGKGRSLTAGQAYQGLRPLALSSEAVQPLLTQAQNAGCPERVWPWVRWIMLKGLTAGSCLQAALPALPQRSRKPFLEGGLCSTPQSTRILINYREKQCLYRMEMLGRQHLKWSEWTVPKVSISDTLLLLWYAC